MEPEIVILAAQAAAIVGAALSAACALAAAAIYAAYAPARAAIRKYAPAAGSVVAAQLIVSAAVLVLPTPVDDCLDAGGRWDARLELCVFEVGPQFGAAGPTPREEI